MRAIVAERFGGYQNLKLADIPKPAASEGRVPVRVTAAGSLTTLGYAASRKATIDVTNLIWKRASIKSFSLFSQPASAWAEAWTTLTGLLKSGQVKPIVARTFPLEGAADALRYLVEGRPFGRVLLTT
jgi:NADPH2:quinone reductase